jgi:hypothetical protein
MWFYRRALLLLTVTLALASFGNSAEARCRYTKAQQDLLYRQYVAFRKAGQQNYDYWRQYRVSRYLNAAKLNARGANNIAARLRACGRKVKNLPSNGNSRASGGGGSGGSNDSPTIRRTVYFVYYQYWNAGTWSNWILVENYCCLSDAIDAVNHYRANGFQSTYTQQTGTWKVGAANGWRCGVNGYMLARRGNGGSWTCLGWIDWENSGTGYQ